jgi:hypothetical protein
VSSWGAETSSVIGTTQWPVMLKSLPSTVEGRGQVWMPKRAKRAARQMVPVVGWPAA